ncbi:hypothetical protein [Devosia nitrariae]|uniref:Uncharacterized protein n=1 Tax=Devosia nitrariae TaxID=2071872 RepID=A0ABQ5WC15_9HYPH|nr:hypothetical protein [Devosia nitrariae]GLQ57248.1 hypothetical protein GCM10010862_45070 [Devosia nitrariae]
MTQLFLDHFEGFGSMLNHYFERSPWSVREISDTDGSSRGERGSRYQRRYAIRNASHQVGTLVLSNADDYSLERPNVHANVEIHVTRTIPASTLAELLFGIAWHVAGATPEELETSHQSIRDATGLDGPPDIRVMAHPTAVRISGSALAYLRRVGIARRERLE